MIEHFEKGYSPSALQRKYKLTYEQARELADELQRLKEENKELKTRLYNIWLECQKPWQQDDERALIDRLAYILHLSSVFKELKK